jgi:hypothetical protein
MFQCKEHANRLPRRRGDSGPFPDRIFTPLYTDFLQSDDERRA